MTAEPPRSAARRKADTLDLLRAPAADVWVATASSDGAEKARIEAFDDKRPIDDRKHDDRERRDRADEIQSRCIDAEDRAEEDMEEIDVRTAQGDDQNPERQ